MKYLSFLSNPRPGVHSTNPMENPLVIDHICSFLQRKELLNCRLLNKQWNSGSLPYLRPLGLRLRLSGMRLVDYSNLHRLGRHLHIEGFATDIKYSLELGYPLRDDVDTLWIRCGSLWTLELDGARRLAEQFGPNCIEKFYLGLGLERGSRSPPLLEVCTAVAVARIVQGSNVLRLTLLFCEVNRKQTDLVEGIVRILNSFSSVKELDLRLPHNWDSDCSELRHPLVQPLQGISPGILEQIEYLPIHVDDPGCYKPLAGLRFPGLKRLKIYLVCVDLEGWNLPDDWPDFKDFVTQGSPSLMQCTFHLDGISVDDFLHQFDDDGIDFEESIPEIEFQVIDTLYLPYADSDED